MKNKENWKATKYAFYGGVLKANRAEEGPALPSRLICDLVAKELQNLIENHVSGSLLDLGCGMVPLYEAYKPYVTRVTCGDWESSFHQNPYIDQVCDLTKPLDFEAESFDTIILSDVLEHLPEPMLVFQEVARILKPGGKVILTTPFLYWLHEEPFDYFRFTHHAFEFFASESQLEVTESRMVGGYGPVLADIFSKVSKKASPNLARLFCPLLLWFGNCTVKRCDLKTNSRRGFSKFPLEYFHVLKKLPK